MKTTAIAIAASILGLLTGGISVYKFLESKIKANAIMEMNINNLEKDIERLNTDLWKMEGSIKELDGKWEVLEEEIDHLQ